MKREVIAFIGRQGSGKSFQSQRLVKERGFKKLSFADPLREIAFHTIGMDFKEGMSKYDELKRTELINGLNFRNILENLGSAIRTYDREFWANALISNIRKIGENVVIDDMRYPNEFEVVRQYCTANGVDFKAYYCNYKSEVYDSNNRHESAALSNYLSDIGYVDGQLVDSKDIMGFASLINMTMPKVSQNTKVDLKQQGEQLISMLKGMKK